MFEIRVKNKTIATKGTIAEAADFIDTQWANYQRLAKNNPTFSIPWIARDIVAVDANAKPRYRLHQVFTPQNQPATSNHQLRPSGEEMSKYEVRANPDPERFPFGTTIYTSTDTFEEAESYIRHELEAARTLGVGARDRIARIIVHVNDSGGEKRVM
jgi:hypothetical protein